MRGPIDLHAVRRGLRRLDAVAAEHPELLGSGPTDPVDWAHILSLAEQVEPSTMRMVQVAFRLPEELLSQIDAFAAQWRDNSPGMRMTRADAIRVLVSKGIESASAESKPSARKARR